MTNAFSPASFSALMAASTVSLETAMHMPTPMLNVLNMSRSGMLPVFAMRSKIGSTGTAERSTLAVRPFFIIRGMFS